ncbi:MAG: NAD(P)H-hydrate dehydratase, partial [Verrucomicrobiales bacterium]|nr:NAD(P)H-hydrate dehydratase [Verrucomicrobiales bacterium]
MLLTPAEMRATEDAAFAAGATPADLMQQAGSGIAATVQQFLPTPGTLVAFVAKGHNGGDALVAARHLQNTGWHVVVRLIGPPADLRPLTRQHLGSLSTPTDILGESSLALPGHRLGTPVAILDGILGIGATGPLKGAYRIATSQLNRLRQHHHATTFAIDLPTGIDSTTGTPSQDAVLADVTITIAHPKTGLLADTATAHVGRLAIVPLAALDTPNCSGADAVVLTPTILRPLLPRLPVDAHKGTAGHVGIIAGSPGLSGAASLSARAALHAGAGLITLYTPTAAHAAIVAQCPPEVMVKPLDDLHLALASEHAALAVGPGLGKAHASEILELISRANCPLILDADALNILADSHLDRLDQRTQPTLLTPHPGEMRRLLGTPITSRLEAAIKLSSRSPLITVLLKGARTLISTSGQPTAYNSTG